MPYSPDHKPKTRLKIIRSAAKLFKTVGYENVTIDQVMANAGLTRGGFYAHFKNKEDLFVATVDSGINLLSEPILSRLRKAEKFGLDWTTAFADLYLSNQHLNHPGKGCALPTLSTEVARSGERAQKAFSKVIRGACGRLAGKLALEGRGIAPMTREEADEWFENPPLDEISKEYRINATAMLSMMVGAMVLGRAVDDETAELILSSVRKTVPRLKSPQKSGTDAAL
ncbi:TetR/AcrR family transcriptional regulator [Thalassospira sp. MCCC 1A03138]|uniref:TetR/AcrR family transcriptional regulator n=1 Tax=Thalassospira sp. MCCC 1A03138 TaxID=1470576 RepID=UPI000A1EA53A|nr:TetR/AcrR family transcriptional regulator [Thalassospira sp. MCCC 1A03138]OSQ28224.1 TetR family transcriptional regulator [Thalassospira sp. MCCC 1A03138]